MAAADAQLAEQLGLSTRTVTDWRTKHLAEGEGWARAEGGRIEWTDEGKASLCAAFRVPAVGPEAVPLADPPPPAPAPEKQEGGPGVFRLRVVKHMPNPTWVAVDVAGTAVPVRIRPAYRPAIGRVLSCVKQDGQFHVIDPTCRPS